MAHDVGEVGAGRADERARDDEQVVPQREARHGRRPTRIGVEHRDDHGHIATTDGEHKVRTKNERDDREDDERQGTCSYSFGSHEPADAHDANDDHDEVEQIAPWKRERFARNARGKL